MPRAKTTVSPSAARLVSNLAPPLMTMLVRLAAEERSASAFGSAAARRNGALTEAKVSGPLPKTPKGFVIAGTSTATYEVLVPIVVPPA